MDICAVGAVLWAGICGFGGDLAEYRRKLRAVSAYAALIAAISGVMPMMLITRLRL